MKTRVGFVSNSSSSSFIIAGDETTEVTVDLNRKVHEIAEEEIYNLQDLDQYMTYEYGVDFLEDKWATEIYNNCKGALYNGKIIYVVHANNDSGDLLNTCMYEERHKIINGKEIWK